MCAKPSPASPKAESSKRKRKSVAYTDLDSSDQDEDAPPKKATKVKEETGDFQSLQGSHANSKRPKKKSKKCSSKDEGEEKRLRRFRPYPPRSYEEIKNRALTQRLTVLERTRCGTDDAPEEKVLMAGSTGNVYTQHICKIPTCDCPHAKKGNQCKHIIYVMLRVLKAPEPTAYQLALTPTELRSLFASAPPIPDATTAQAAEDTNRKPIEGECPICYTEFDADDDRDAVAYCKASCGNNVHAECMAAWRRARSGKATCPYCRSEWESDGGGEGAFGGKIEGMERMERGEEGYVNVAGRLGLSGRRDYSTYHYPWVRQHLGLTGTRRRRY
ncbi:hypothetical protein BS50DRAFT_558106 [Corynespora cassiicola Philippines]|uniref:Uncharacterized protein n=1 Tax=Corynespora cassiicola Philippines TaxID=1448308 RepID=A0A2T2NF44_CORCC|nr:hypothetical protein BS50DRAFT_558106 [Corynespora cassiicola Philippines]